MRIITGKARGRRLHEPKSIDIRPTTDMVKESLFNIIQFDIEGRRVLDLFAGTGQLGLEALSRGASSCVFVDESRQAVSLVQENLAHCGLTGGTVVAGDALEYLRRCSSFDLVFIDPPFESSLSEKALRIIKEFDILSEGGIIVCETRRDRPLPKTFSECREYCYGTVKLTIFRRTGP
jgi:16S rRNA (guanine(966)-N(2))-methyltransferase RsmD